MIGMAYAKMCDMTITTWYTTSRDFNTKLTLDDAIATARTSGADSEDMVWVYGNTEFSEDDKTPIGARTYFWRQCGFSIYRTSGDGR